MKKNSESIYDTVVSNTQKIFTHFFKENKENTPDFNFEEINYFLDNSPTVALIYNHRTFSYEYISPNIKDVTGFEDKAFLKGGLKFAMSLILPSHAKLYNRFVLPVMFKYYTLYAFRKRIKDLRFSYTFKIKKSNGEYWWALHHMNAIKVNKFGFPLHTIVHISDVTQIKTDESINISVFLRQPTGSFKPIYSRTYEEDASFVFSNRELEVLDLIVKGKTSKEISNELNISFHTVITHRKNMMEKSGVKNSSELVQMAYNKNIIREPRDS